MVFPFYPSSDEWLNNFLSTSSKVFRKHGIIVISDEIYGRLHYKQQHATLAKVSHDGEVHL